MILVLHKGGWRLKINIPKNIKFDIGPAIKEFGNGAKKLVSNKGFQATLVSIPVIGWITSEIQRAKEASEHDKQIKLYQEALRKHQVIIDTLENDKEREAYKQKLWEEVNRRKVEVSYE